MPPPQSSTDDARGYLPIRDYALIGDCHGSALVGRDGSIDWCCLGRFDADPVFCRVLDRSRGGFLSVTPLARFSVARSYLDGTNILQTVFSTDQGNLVVTDFMPVGRRPGSGTHNYVDLVAPNWLVRSLEALRGAVPTRISYRPNIDFARQQPQLELAEDGISIDRGPFLSHNVTGFAVESDRAEAMVTVQPGRRLVIIVSAERVDARAAVDRIESYRNITTAFWREWIAYCRYRGPYADQVKRSLLTIKLLIYAPSGALAAAPTSSLPEEIGGCRNWDYRYCWLRDTTSALYALAVTGYGGEARRFSHYLPRVCAATAPTLRIMYGIDGESDLEEKTLGHLDGYEGSRPVRTGNGAFTQRQIDVYGEILDWALLFETLGGKLDKAWRPMLAALAGHVCDHWHEPDQGLWEMRGPALHHVHGKIMSWVALDRALKLVGENMRWRRESEGIIKEVSVRGRGIWHDHLIQAFDRPAIDAALLLALMTAFPLHDRVLRNTVNAIDSELRAGDFVYRYRTQDGVAGGEGAFLICSFWLVDAFLQCARHAEAKELFENLLAHANDVGLYAEQIDPATRMFLGNFPQAYTHLALIGSAVHLQLYEQHGAKALQGSYADRAKLMVSATLGWRGLWAAFKATWKVGRVLSSRKSVLAMRNAGAGRAPAPASARAAT